MFDDDTQELLTPAPDLQSMIDWLGEKEVLLTDAAVRVVKTPWNAFDFIPFSEELARFALYKNGFTLGETFPEHEVLHKLSTELAIMSPGDLDERFLHTLEGAPLTREFRRLAQVPDIRGLLKNTTGLGWSGFHNQTVSEADARQITRRRMVIDANRELYDWTALRAWEISEAAALIHLARSMGMLNETTLLPYAKRLTTEAAVRFVSWADFALSLLRAQLFSEAAEDAAELIVRLGEDWDQVEAALQGPWLTTEWPIFTGADPYLTVPA